MINFALTIRNMFTSFIEGVMGFPQLLYDIFLGLETFLSAPKWLGDILKAFNCPDEVILFLNGNWFAVLFSKAFTLTLFVLVCFKLFLRIIHFINPLN